MTNVMHGGGSTKTHTHTHTHANICHSHFSSTIYDSGMQSKGRGEGLHQQAILPPHPIHGGLPRSQQSLSEAALLFILVGWTRPGEGGRLASLCIVYPTNGPLDGLWRSWLTFPKWSLILFTERGLQLSALFSTANEMQGGEGCLLLWFKSHM